MARLYPFGSKPVWLTEAQLRRTATFGRLHPEIQRRNIALMDIAQDAGHGMLGISGGWRDGAYAASEWERRYTPTNQTRRVKNTDKLYEGVWYSLNPGEIGCATPWNGWHTWPKPDTIPPGVEPYDPVATDWYRELAWMQKNCHRVGLRSFQHVPGEGHHTQPVEYPADRKSWRTHHKLTVWPIAVKEYEMQRIQVWEDGQLDSAVFTLAADRAWWCPDPSGTISACLAPLTGDIQPVYRPVLFALDLVGPAPTYPAGYTGPRTRASDFRGPA